MSSMFSANRPIASNEFHIDFSSRTAEAWFHVNVDELPADLISAPQRLIRKGRVQLDDLSTAIVVASGNSYEIHRNGDQAGTRTEESISEKDFEAYWKCAEGRSEFVRYNWTCDERPLMIDIYVDASERPSRAMIQFNTMEAAKAFKPPNWLTLDSIDC